MSTNTTNYNLIKPAVDDPADADIWGNSLNTNMDTIDSTMKSISTPADTSIVFNDNTTGNVSTSAHGFAPKAPNDTSKYLDGSGAYSSPTPSGTILDFAGTSVPSGFLPCDGAAVSRTTYARLYAAIGTTWGVGDGSTTFNVPNMNRRVAIGSGGSATATISNTVGSTGGEEAHQLTIPEMPAHTHTVPSYTSNFNSSSGRVITGLSIAGTDPVTSSTGGDGAHNNMQPSAVVLKIIKT